MEFSTVEDLITALKDSDPARREEAAYEIGCMEDPSLLPHLENMIRDPSHRVRWRVLQSMGKLGPSHLPDDFPALLKDESSLVRAEAAKVLGLTADKAHAHGLLQLFDDEDLQVRCRAIEAIGELGADDESFMSRVLLLLQDEDTGIRMQAALALGTCRYLPALPNLLVSLEDRSPNVRGFAAWAVGNLGHEQAIEPLVRALDDAGEHVRIYAYQAIASFGKKALLELEKALARCDGASKLLVESLIEDVLTEEGRKDVRG